MHAPFDAELVLDVVEDMDGLHAARCTSNTIPAKLFLSFYANADMDVAAVSAATRIALFGGSIVERGRCHLVAHIPA